MTNEKQKTIFILKAQDIDCLEEAIKAFSHLAKVYRKAIDHAGEWVNDE